jgi:hypothetical protein
MSFQRFRERSRDVQDGIERHVWGEQEYTGQGSVIKVNGTDTKDEEAPVLNNGTSFNLKKDHNSEVMLLSSGSDTTLKMAVLTIPRDKQRRWRENTGGVQHPTDDEFALEFDEYAHITKNQFVVGQKGELQVKDDQAFLRVKKLIVDGELVVNTKIKTPKIEEGSEKPPSFTPKKQAPIKDDSSKGQQQAVDARQLDLFANQYELAV